MKISNVLDMTSRFIERVKTIAVLVLLVLFVLSLVNNGCNRDRVESLVEKVTGLNVQNDILLIGIHSAKKEIEVLKGVEDSLLGVVALKDLDIKKLKRSYSDLEIRLSEVTKVDVTEEEGYKFLMEEAYPYTGELRFPFNGLQVRGMYRTYLEYGVLSDQKQNLLSQVSALEDKVDLLGSQLDTRAAMFLKSEENVRSYEQVSLNKDTIISLQEGKIAYISKMDKRRKWVVPVGVTLGFVVGLILGR